MFQEVKGCYEVVKNTTQHSAKVFAAVFISLYVQTWHFLMYFCTFGSLGDTEFLFWGLKLKMSEDIKQILPSEAH